MAEHTNPRYVAYAATHGRDPDAQMRHDKARWPGGVMTGFSIFIQTKVREFAAAHPEHCIGDRVLNQDAFTKFLQQHGKTEKDV